MQGNNRSPHSIEGDSGSPNFSESRSKSAGKRRSTRSRVWEKVAWFTRKGKGGKENITCGAGLEEQCPEFAIKNRNDEEGRRGNRQRVRDYEYKRSLIEHNNSKGKSSGVRKTRSFSYLKRRKPRQFGRDLGPGVFEEVIVPTRVQETATGTFHDFISERRPCARQDSNNSVLNEIARGIQGSRSDMKENTQSVLSLPLDDLSLSEKRSSHSESMKHSLDNVPASSVKSSFPVGRSCSFSGSTYNSWPRKKRTSLGNQSTDVLSPPQKQKRLSGLKKTATFSGFDSPSKLNIKEAYLCKGVKSTPHLLNGSQIKNQDGSTIGIIHFYKSPKDFQMTNTNPQPELLLPNSGSSILDDHSNTPFHSLKSSKHSSVCPRDGSSNLKSEELTSPKPPQCGNSAENKEPGSSHLPDGIVSGQQKLQLFNEKHRNSSTELSKLVRLEEYVGSPSSATFSSGEILGARLCDPYNVYNVATLGCATGSEHNGRGSWADSQDEQSPETEEQETLKGPSIKLIEGATVRKLGTTKVEGTCGCLEVDGKDVIKQNITADTLITNSSSLGFVINDICAIEDPGSSPASEAIADELYHPSLEDSKRSVGCQTESAERTCYKPLQKPGIHYSAVNILETSAEEDCDFAGASCLSECSPVVKGFNTNESCEGRLCTDAQNGHEISVKSVTSGKQAEGVKVLTRESPRTPTLSGQVFKQHMEVILQYFCEFNDEQKNIMIKRILEHCELPQMHMLSVAMEPVLHQSCPPNCQDMLAWLPFNVTSNVLSYLDAVSLCRCSQVNKMWNNLASNSVLWQSLCRIPDWQLSRSSEERQLLKYKTADGAIQWKRVLAERFLLRQNWLKGRCKVRTFEGHTQGISCVQFDDSRIASGSSDKTIKVWDMNSGDPNAVLTLAGHSGTVRCLNLNGNRLVSGSVDRSIKVWDLSFESYWSGASCKVTMLGHMHTVRCLQVDDDKVVSGSYDKTLKVWDIKTGHCRLTLRGHNAAVLCVQFDDRKIVSGSYDKTIKVWSLEEGSCLMTLTGHHDAVTCLNLTFDGTKVISGSLDHNLKFWDLATGKSIGTLDWIRSEGHTGVVRCLQSDSWRIVSAGDDKTMKMWSLETGQRLLTLRCHTDGVTCLQFNDYRIVSGSYDQTVKLWNFAPLHEFLS